MSASRNVEENSVYEEQEGLDVQELAPGKAKIKKELRQSLIVDTQTVKFSRAINSSLSLVCPLLCQLPFLFDIHKTLVLFFFSRRLLFLTILFTDLLKLRILPCLLALLHFSLDINLPVLLSRFNC